MAEQWRTHALGPILALEETTSTQDRARALIEAGDTRTVAVAAAQQTRGRGRLGARWLTDPGACLLLTAIVRGAPAAPDRLGWLSLAAGVAVSEAVERAAGVAPTLKWPNDLQCGGRKLAGVLVETVPGVDGAVALVGTGVNVNVARFDGDLERTATSLLRETGSAYPVDTLCDAVVNRVLAWAAADDADILAAWRRRDGTSGVRYVAATGDGEVSGSAEGVAEDGSLLLRTDDGRLMPVRSATAADRRRLA